jgi:hypothetical protein
VDGKQKEETTMAEKIEGKKILSGLIMQQNGKALTGEPEAGNVAVAAKPDSPLIGISAVEIVAALTAAYPRCVFTFCAAGFPAPKEPAKK